jgi:hypothetical protein
MMGEPLASVQNGLDVLKSALMQNPQALETAYVSIIEFDKDAKQTLPLTEVMSFTPPQLTLGSTTSLGAALTLLAQCIKAEVRQNTPEQKGDWKPLIFIMTDGMPTDSIEPGIQALNSVPHGMIIGCAAGPQAQEDTLRRITEVVVKLDTIDRSTMEKFFQWVSASIGVSSQKIDLTGVDLTNVKELPAPPAGVNLVV